MGNKHLERRSCFVFCILFLSLIDTSMWRHTVGHHLKLELTPDKVIGAGCNVAPGFSKLAVS